MRTDVRLIALVIVLALFAAMWCLAADKVLYCIVPVVVLCGVIHHINRNKAYYEGQIDDLYGQDDELV